MNQNLKELADALEIDTSNGMDAKLQKFANLIIHQVSMICEMTRSGIVTNKDVQEGRKIASEIIESRVKFWFQPESYSLQGENHA